MSVSVPPVQPITADGYDPTSMFGALLMVYLAPWLTLHMAWLLDQAVGTVVDPVYTVVADVGVDDGVTPTVGTYLNGQIVTDGYQPGWGVLLNPLTCPADNLPYLAQFAGVKLPMGIDEASARSLIIAEGGLSRGTDAAVIAAAQRFLTGTKSVVLLPRTYVDGTPSAGHFVLIVRSDEISSGISWVGGTFPWTAAAGTWTGSDQEAQLVAAVNAVKFGGLMWNLVVSDGFTWAEATDTWADEPIPWRQAGLSLDPGADTNIEVNHAPTGPATPVGGWSVVMADGFSTVAPTIGAAGSFWGPNRDSRAGTTSNYRPGFNTNEVAVFNNSNVSVDSSGLNLTATFDSGIGSTLNTAHPSQGFETGANYVSGALWSSPTTGFGGAPGWPNITGFLWNPQSTSAKTVFEVVWTVPFDNTATQGSDMAFWASDGPGAVEFDFPEMAQVLVGFTTGGSSIWAAINHTAVTTAETQAFNTPTTYDAPVWMTDGAEHRLTCEIDANAQTINQWVDGVQVAGGPFSYSTLSPLSTNGMGIYLSYGFRNNGGSQAPSFSGSEIVTVRSVAVYQDTPHAGQGIVGGGIQTGTVII